MINKISNVKIHVLTIFTVWIFAFFSLVYAQEGVRSIDSPLAKLTPTADHLDSTPSWQAGHQFGTVRILDLLPDYKGQEVSSLTHTFIFKNAGLKAVEVSSVESDCSCTRARIDELDFQGLPYLVPSGKDIRVSVTIDPRLVSSGQIKRMVKLGTQNQDSPLATMTMEGFIANGLTISDGDNEEKIIKLKAVPEGFEQRRQIILTLDRRLPLYFQDGTLLKLVTTDSKLILSPFFGSAPNGVEIDNDVVKIVKGGRPLAKDIILRYELKQLVDMPPGKVDARIVLAIDKEPTIKVLHRVAIPVQGYVVRRKRVEPSVGE